jgi:hypothetical protein
MASNIPESIYCKVLLTICTGYDASLMSSINALPNYTKYYGLPASGNASTGIVFAIFAVSVYYNLLGWNEY